MDFESCFIDCCLACNSSCQNFNSLSMIQGQGDCKDSINFQEHQNKWEKEKKMRKQFWEEDKLDFKEEKQKKFLNAQCDCSNKDSKTEDYKIANDTKYERKNYENIKKYNIPWNSSYASWSNNKIKKSGVAKDFKNNECLNSDLLLAESMSELKEKVEFLFKIFQDYGPELLRDRYKEQSHPNYTETTFGDICHLFNINKRLSVAEKGIQKLTMILEHILKSSNKMKACFSKETSIFTEPLNFEKMSITQRINLLKNRNDFLFGLMRDFLKVRSVDELYSTMGLHQTDYELNENCLPTLPTFQFIEENQSKDFDTEDVLETLEQLRTQFTELNGKICNNGTDNENHLVRQEKREENTAKCYKNTLEVISEQAELALYYDNKNEDTNEFRKKNIRHLKGKFSEVKQEYKEKDSSISEMTAKLLAEEAMLKSSLDKAHFKILSEQNSSEKSLSLGQSHQLNLSIEIPTEDENNEADAETSLDSVSCVYCETENGEISKLSDTKRCSVHEEYKEQIKQERNVESMSRSLSKPNIISNKKASKRSESRNNSYSREEIKNEVRVKDQKRPMTTPGFHNKTLHTSVIKTLVPQKNERKYSGIINVKNKNKFLSSQKSCVQMA